MSKMLFVYFQVVNMETALTTVLSVIVDFTTILNCKTAAVLAVSFTTAQPRAQ